jgi:hypothetical protein
MPNKPTKRCRDGHRKTDDNVIIKRTRHWNKKTGTWKTYEHRKCKTCEDTARRLLARRRRALGKQLSYPQWLAQRKDAR